MPKEKTISKTDKRLKTLADKAETNKRAIVEQFRKTPIVEYACKYVGIGRSTYYKWRIQDVAFARASDHALRAGRFFINDVAESQLIRLVKEGHMTAIIFWLKNNHPNYTYFHRSVEEYNAWCDDSSKEEKQIGNKMMAENMAMALGNIKIPPEKFKEFMEAKDANEEKECEIDESIKKYEKEEDSQT